MTRMDTLPWTARRELARFCADESGATAIEYGMIASGVGVFSPPPFTGSAAR